VVDAVMMVMTAKKMIKTRLMKEYCILIAASGRSILCEALEVARELAQMIEERCCTNTATALLMLSW
jgi:hypothetical protein